MTKKEKEEEKEMTTASTLTTDFSWDLTPKATIAAPAETNKPEEEFFEDSFKTKEETPKTLNDFFAKMKSDMKKGKKPSGLSQEEEEKQKKEKKRRKKKKKTRAERQGGNYNKHINNKFQLGFISKSKY